MLNGRKIDIPAKYPQDAENNEPQVAPDSCSIAVYVCVSGQAPCMAAVVSRLDTLCNAGVFFTILQKLSSVTYTHTTTPS